MGSTRIVIGGPTHSGKSVFTVYFYWALRQSGIRTYHYDYDPYSPTRLLVLGDITGKEREKLKGPVSKNDVLIHAKKFKQNFNQYTIVVGDLPGQISETTKLLAKSGTRGIIVCDEKKDSEIKDWKLMFDELKIKTICIIRSNLRGIDEIDNNEQEIITAKISNLDVNNMANNVPLPILVLSQKIRTKLSL